MKFKLLIISFDFRPHLGGVATCAYELACALSKQNIEVKVIAPYSDGVDQFDQHNIFKTKRVKLQTSAIRSIFKLKKEIENEIDYFHPAAMLNLLWMPDGLATFFAHRKKIPYFQVIHGVEVIESLYSLRKILRFTLSPLKNKVLKSAQEIFCVSHFTKELVQRYCPISDDKIFIINNGANPQNFYPKVKNDFLLRKHNLHHRFCFLTIGRLEDYKGIDMAIEAFRNLKHGPIPFKYLIGGTGPDLMKLKKMVKDFELQEFIEFIGMIPPELLVDYYNLSDCFITLSREDYKTPNVEGFGLVFLEAALCQIPTLAGNSGGIPDAVIDPTTGWLVDPQNITQIARTIESILQSPEEVKKRGMNAYERVLSHLTWDHMANKIIKRLEMHVRN